MAYRLSRKAEDDILEVFRSGVERFGLHQADRYHAQLETTFQFLGDNPLAARERPEIMPPVRVHPIGSHLIVYTLDDRDEVLILRIRHANEGWQQGAD
jgi:toxin ParE1/3/4